MTGSTEAAGGARVPPIHVVTDDALLGGAGFVDRAAGLLRAGGRRLALHLRGPGSPGRLVYERAEALAPVAAESGSLLLVNDRIDVALAAGAAGVQLGARGVAPAEARGLIGAERVLGVSVHSVAEAAEIAGYADFIVVGTIYATPSHAGRPASGPALVAAVRRCGRPAIGIGGITAGRIAELRRAGAAGVAVQRAVWAAADPEAALNELSEAWIRTEPKLPPECG